MGKQIALAARPDARNVVQHGPSLSLLAAPAMTGDGEAVGFVADLLEKVHGRSVRCQRQFPAPGKDDRFQARLARRSLGDAEQRDILQVQLLKYLGGTVHLSGTAVDDDHVGQHALALGKSRVAAPNRLLDGALVVARGHALDIEAPVVGLRRPVGVEYDARRHGGFAARMADVEAL